MLFIPLIKTLEIFQKLEGLLISFKISLILLDLNIKMDFPRDVDLYLKESIDDSLGLPISLQTLESKLRASEESQRLLRQQHLYLLSKLKEKDQLIERTKVCLSAFLLNRFWFI